MTPTLRALRPIYGRLLRPSRSTIERLLEIFEFTGTVKNVRQRSTPSVENIAAAEASLEKMCLSHVVLKGWASL